MFILAHLSDPHLAPMQWPRPRDLINKRMLGFVNWHFRRRAFHRAEVLDALITDMKQASPDHIAVTGDLVNISLEHEFTVAQEWLRRLGDAKHVTLVPGNHDAYVRASAHHASRVWREYMREADEDAADPKEPFPFVRRRGPVALIGVSTAIPTGPFAAKGEVGPAQLERLRAALKAVAAEPLFRVLVIHHPPLSTKQERHKRLIDAEAVRALLREYGVELVIHGHEHIHSLVWLDGPAGRIPAFGVPSASADVSDAHPAGYNLYRIGGKPGAWQCEAISRGLRADETGFVELHRETVHA